MLWFSNSITQNSGRLGNIFKKKKQKNMTTKKAMKNIKKKEFCFHRSSHIKFHYGFPGASGRVQLFL